MIKTKILCTIGTAIGILFTSSALAVNRMPDFQTTRLKSTGGAGVASILMDEATVLNPAPLAFFSLGSFYFQKMNTKSNYEAENNSILDGEKESSFLSVIATDTKKSIKGSARYSNQDYLFNKRKQFAFSVASIAGKQSSFGVTYRLTKDKVSNDSKDFKEEKYNQTIFGATHILNKNFSLGIVFIDPLKARKNDTKAIAGLQYIFRDYVSFMFDFGADYNRDLAQTSLWKGAIQFKVLNDFYVRAGIFDDKSTREKGNGVGIGWLQPKLNLEFALVNRELMDDESLNQTAEDIKEHLSAYPIGFNELRKQRRK